MTVTCRTHTMEEVDLDLDVKELPGGSYCVEVEFVSIDTEKTEWDESKHTPEEIEQRNLSILNNKKRIVWMIGMNFSLAHDRVERFVHDYEFDVDQEMRRPTRNVSPGESSSNPDIDTS